MLSTNVKTTGELMSIALQAEREAIRRYTQLAVEMHKGSNESAAALFERMVSEEQEHERLLLEWMAQENIKEMPEIGPIKWRDPQVLTTYDDEARDPYHSTPYRALAFAVHNEEIAFRFYTHVAAESANDAVRKYAEILAREELGHAALLRAERRRAYHAERKNNMSEPRLEAKNINNAADLLAAAIHINRYLLEEFSAIAETSPKLDALIKETRQQITNYEDMLEAEKTVPGEDITQNIDLIETYNAHQDKTSDTPEINLIRLCACCDRSFALYDEVVETASDHTVMLLAQNLTSSALDRIGALKDVLGNTYLSEEACD